MLITISARTITITIRTTPTTRIRRIILLTEEHVEAVAVGTVVAADEVAGAEEVIRRANQNLPPKSRTVSGIVLH